MPVSYLISNAVGYYLKYNRKLSIIIDRETSDQRGLIKKSKIKKKDNIKYYCFDPEPETINTLPENIQEYIKKKGSEPKNDTLS